MQIMGLNKKMMYSEDASDDCIKEAKIIIEKMKKNPEMMADYKRRLNIIDEEDEMVIAQTIANNRQIKQSEII